MPRKNISRSKKLKKSGCGCIKSFRLWGGKNRKNNRRSKKSKKTRKIVRGGGCGLGGFVLEQTFPFPGVSCANTIPLSGNIGGAGDPNSSINITDARQTNV